MVFRFPPVTSLRFTVQCQYPSVTGHSHAAIANDDWVRWAFSCCDSQRWLDRAHRHQPESERDSELLCLCSKFKFPLLPQQATLDRLRDSRGIPRRSADLANGRVRLCRHVPPAHWHGPPRAPASAAVWGQLRTSTTGRTSGVRARTPVKLRHAHGKGSRAVL